MNIWVDIANPPQVLFLRPIIAELEKRSHRIIITTRSHSETIALADSYGLSHKVIGAHGGGTLIGKAVAVVFRALSSGWYLRHQNISLAVSCSSFSQAIATKWLNLPMVSLDDYEGNPGMHIVCRVAEKIIVPDLFAKQNLYPYGASEDQFETYNGLKEDVYLSEFVPDPLFLDSVGIPKDKVLVTMRPASDVSAYHQFENPLFEEALKYVASYGNTFVIVLPRNAEQRQKYQALGLANVIFPGSVLDGPNLVYYSDLIVGAGGTMNREAVVLGTPVYNLFMGKLGSIDRHLIDSGKMTRIKDNSDIQGIKIAKKDNSKLQIRQTGKNLINEIANKILNSYI